MILVADSGSTKCDWLLVDAENKREKTNTMGFNPFFHSTELIQSKIEENEILMHHVPSIKEIYFYGAGCSSPERNLIVELALKNVFHCADLIKVDHDLTGAAVATAMYDEGICCILGTGSNSCYYDGKKTHEAVPALGYILGDEGSGSYFGKFMLSEWLYHRMPADLAEEFQETYDLSKESIFEATYNKANPNVYLASFMKFVSDHKEHAYFKNMIYEGLAKFAAIHIWCYDNFREVPVNFVGSIAYYFRSELEEVAKNHRFTLGKIEKRPIYPIADFHYKNSFKNNESQSVNL